MATSREKLHTLSQTNLPLSEHPKKRKKSKKDGAWRPEKKADEATSSFVEARFNHSKENVYSVLFPKTTPLTPETRRELSTKIIQNAGPTFSPIKDIIEKKETGTPTKVQTKTGKTLILTLNLDKVQFFHSSSDPLSDPEQPKILKKIEEEKNTKFIAPPEKNIKKCRVCITAELLNLVKKERKKNHGKRLSSQNSKMGGSATDYVRTLGFDFTAEWAHLLPYFAVGEISQNPNNLVATSKECNTAMILIESQIPRLANSFSLKQPFDIEVTAHLYPNTHVAQKIEYNFLINGQSFLLTFDAQLSINPHIAYKKIIDVFFETLLEREKLGSLISTPTLPSPIKSETPEKCRLFYTPPKKTTSAPTETLAPRARRKLELGQEEGGAQEPPTKKHKPS